MALDFYVGGFSRYYAREWENVAQKYCRETGAEYHLIGPDGPVEPAKWEDVAEAVTDWREALNGGLGANLSSPLDWDESRKAPYFTDRPTYDGYGALVVWAAHAERGSMPPKDYSGEWMSDEAYLETASPKQGQKYRPIITGSLWLPGDFEFSFDFKNLTGDDVHICSCPSLKRSLDVLNESTFRMTQKEIDVASQGEIDQQDGLRSWARFGYALMSNLAAKSVEHHLPLLLCT